MKSYLENKTIFITGGTGSFGKEFVKECLINHNPKKVIMTILDINLSSFINTFGMKNCQGLTFGKSAPSYFLFDPTNLLFSDLPLLTLWSSIPTILPFLCDAPNV